MWGFPGESDEDFRDTLHLIEQVGFDSVFAFEYSDRPEAPAARFTDKIDLAVKHRRLQELFSLQKDITRQKHQELVGQTFSVLVEGASKNHLKNTATASPIELTGRTSENRIVNFDGLPEWGIDIDRLKGQTVDVEITRAYSNSLWGFVL